MQDDSQCLIQGRDQKSHSRGPKNQAKDQQHGHTYRKQRITLQLPALGLQEVKETDYYFSKAVHARYYLPCRKRREIA